jgi:transposase
MYARTRHEVIPRERCRLHNIARVMVWAAVGIGFKSPIVQFPQKQGEDDEKKPFRLNGDSYVTRCLSRAIPAMKGRWFLQDGARPHVTHRVRRYLTSRTKWVEDFPPYSPDLNMIECVWPLLNMRIAMRKPHDLASLRTAITAAWDSITQAEIDSICSGFSSRIKAVHELQGHHA